MTTTIDGQVITNGYSYSRISSGSQSKGAGISRQSDKAAQICKDKGWQLVPQTLVDLGYSAYTGKNLLEGCLKDFVHAARTGKLLPNPVLIIEQWDRFSRQDIDVSEPLIIELLKLGVAIHNSFTNQTYTKGSTKDIASRITILLGFKQAHEYSANLSKRVSDSFQRKYVLASQGKAVQLGNWQPRWITFVGPAKGVGEFRLNEVASVIQSIVRDYLNGIPMQTIAIRLNKSKTPCIGRGKSWGQGQIAYLLHSESLIGHIEINGQRFPNYFPPVITNDQWTLLQSKLVDNRNKKGGQREGQYVANLFRNRCRCAHCGGSVTSARATLKEGVTYYYKCSNARLNPNLCDVTVMMPIREVEEDFFLLFLQQHPSELLGKDTADFQSKLADVQFRIQKVEKDQEDVAQLIGKFPVKALEKKMVDIQQRMDSLTQERDTIHKQLTTASTSPQAITDIRKALVNIDVTDDFDKAYDQVKASLKNPDVRAKLLQLIPSLVENITIDFYRRVYAITTKNGSTTAFRPSDVTA